MVLRQEIWLDQAQMLADLHQEIWPVNHLWAMTLVATVLEEHNQAMPQWVNQDQRVAHLRVILQWVILQWVNQDQQMAHLRVILQWVNQAELIHYLVKQDQQAAHLRAICLRVILQWVNLDQWTADQADQPICLLQWMIWAQLNRTWMMQQLMALKNLDQELLNQWQVIWMEMA